jgi:hypothetical protein
MSKFHLQNIAINHHGSSTSVPGGPSQRNSTLYHHDAIFKNETLPPIIAYPPPLPSNSSLQQRPRLPSIHLLVPDLKFPSSSLPPPPFPPPGPPQQQNPEYCLWLREGVAPGEFVVIGCGPVDTEEEPQEWIVKTVPNSDGTVKLEKVPMNGFCGGSGRQLVRRSGYANMGQERRAAAA